MASSLWIGFRLLVSFTSNAFVIGFMEDEAVVAVIQLGSIALKHAVAQHITVVIATKVFLVVQHSVGCFLRVGSFSSLNTWNCVLWNLLFVSPLN